MSRRIPAQCERDLVLHILREGGSRGTTTSEMRVAGVRPPCAARVEQLRERGYVISSERLGPAEWRDTLLAEPSPGGAPA